jgi:hypothetical protein
LDVLPRQPALRRTGEPEITAKEHTMKIAVAGATGRLGRHVAEVLTACGHLRGETRDFVAGQDRSLRAGTPPTSGADGRRLSYRVR